MIPAIGVRPPLLIFVIVRAIAPVAGIPPKRGEARLATPWAISSVFESWWSPITPSATVADKRLSMAPNMAMVIAGDTSCLIVSHVISGTWALGSSLEIENLSPMVSMLPIPPKFFNNNATIVINMMATREPGIFLLNRGVMAMTITLAIPIMAVHRSVVFMFCIYTIHFSTKSDGTDVSCKPNKSFICVVNIVTAIPLVKPTTIG